LNNENKVFKLEGDWVGDWTGELIEDKDNVKVKHKQQLSINYQFAIFNYNSYSCLSSKT
jgi:hypothetical protein